MRIRIALATAAAVIVVAVPAVLVSLLSSDPAWARVTRHEAVSIHQTIMVNPKVMSYDQARQLAQFVSFTNAVTLAQEENYLKEVAFLRTLQTQAFYNAILRQEAQATAAHARLQASAAQAPVAAPAPAPVSSGGGSDATSTNTPDWACIRQRESGGNYGEGGGGAYQFALGTWRGLTGLPSPAEASPPLVQDAAALKLFAERGWQPWTTRSLCGL